MALDLKQLCVDTLYYIQRIPRTSCLVSNEYAARLRECGTEAIPAIEEVIKEVVTPKLEDHISQNGFPDLNEIIRMGPPFSGLDDLLGAYWLICARTEPRHAIMFFKTMPVSVVFEAIECLPTYFNKHNPAFNIPLPKDYQAYVDALQCCGIPELVNVARYASNRLRV